MSGEKSVAPSLNRSLGGLSSIPDGVRRRSPRHSINYAVYAGIYFRRSLDVCVDEKVSRRDQSHTTYLAKSLHDLKFCIRWTMFTIEWSCRKLKFHTQHDNVGSKEKEMIQQIATIAVYIEDQQRAVKFWTEQVGFEICRDQPMGPGGSWIEVGPKGAQTCLVLYPRAMMPNWTELKPSIVFVCDDIKRTFETLQTNGVRFVEGLKAMSWGTYVKFADPDGNEFLLKG